MARVTIEDCVDKVSNRFDLVLYAAHLARKASAAGEEHKDKYPIEALRKIASGEEDPEIIRQLVITHTERHANMENPFGSEDQEEAALLKELERDTGEFDLFNSDKKAETKNEDFDEQFLKDLEALSDMLPDSEDEDGEVAISFESEED